jgi:hypothetical protein
LRPNISSDTSIRNAQSRAVVFAPPDLTSAVLRVVIIQDLFDETPAPTLGFVQKGGKLSACRCSAGRLLTGRSLVQIQPPQFSNHI